MSGKDMEECFRVEAVAQSWEDEGTVSLADFDLLLTHCAGCSACSLRYSWLLALLERDTHGQPVSDREEPRAGFSEEVMRTIGTAPRGRATSPLAWAGMVAAFLVLLGGIGFLVQRLLPEHPAEVIVHFELVAPEAREVTLVGSFNGWNPTAFPMKEVNRDGVWRITIRLKKGTTNTYNFLIDGTKWVPDPGSPVQVDDGFGGKSSVLRL